MTSGYEFKFHRQMHIGLEDTQVSAGTYVLQQDDILLLAAGRVCFPNAHECTVRTESCWCDTSLLHCFHFPPGHGTISIDEFVHAK
jgi:hypothetical protein